MPLSGFVRLATERQAVSALLATSHGIRRKISAHLQRAFLVRLLLVVHELERSQ